MTTISNSGLADTFTGNASVFDCLDELEAESIFILREVNSGNLSPVLLYSAGKDSAVLLHLCKKAFFPSTVPFPLLHVDTTWKFSEIYAARDMVAKKSRMKLIVHQNPEALKRQINPFDHGSLHTDLWKTDGLKQALSKYNFDTAISGARRDEEASRSKERIFSFRTAEHSWDPKCQRPELWSLFNTNLNDNENMRVFPMSNWTELDVWKYILRERIDVPSLYFSASRPTVERNGTIFMVDDKRFRFRDGEKPKHRHIRFRTLGCYPLTGAVESYADNLLDIINEISLSEVSERSGSLIDQDPDNSMEKKKREGYF